MTSAFHILILLLFVAIPVIGSEEVSVSERLENDRKWKLKYGGLGTGHYEMYFFLSLSLSPLSLAFQVGKQLYTDSSVSDSLYVYLFIHHRCFGKKPHPP